MELRQCAITYILDNFGLSQTTISWTTEPVPAVDAKLGVREFSMILLMQCYVSTCCHGPMQRPGLSVFGK